MLNHKINSTYSKEVKSTDIYYCQTSFTALSLLKFKLKLAFFCNLKIIVTEKAEKIQQLYHNYKVIFDLIDQAADF